MAPAKSDRLQAPGFGCTPDGSFFDWNLGLPKLRPDVPALGDFLLAEELHDRVTHNQHVFYWKCTLWQWQHLLYCATMKVYGSEQAPMDQWGITGTSFMGVQHF